jgi:protein-tyrosine phosphatase
MLVPQHRSAPGWYLVAATAAAALMMPPAHAIAPSSDKPGMDNFDEVAPHIYRGSNPNDDDLVALKKLGVTTIVDLRMRHSYGEEQAAKRLGLKWVHLSMGYWAPSDHRVKQILHVLTDANNGGVFIHCKQGSDRTGTIVALYRILVQNWPFEQAYSEMRAHHFKPWWFALREKVETYSENSDLAELALHGSQEEKVVVDGQAPREE